MDTGRCTSHIRVCGGYLGEGQQEVESWGGVTWGEMPDTGDGEEGRNHTAMCVPMQQSYMFFTCTSKPKM